MKFIYYLKDTIKKTTALVLLIPGTLLLIIAIFGLFSEMEKNNRQGIYTAYGVMAFTLVMLIPGILLYRSGQKQTKQENKVRQLATILSTYRRLGLTDLAKKMGLTETEAESLLTLAIDQQIISGYIDRTTGEFFISGSLQEIKNLSKCPNCGAPVSQIFYSGETAKCQACGSLFH